MSLAIQPQIPPGPVLGQGGSRRGSRVGSADEWEKCGGREGIP